jgi:hypothetical protein
MDGPGPSDEELAAPLSSLADPDRGPVEVGDMAEYPDLFAVLEGTALNFWKAHPEATDELVLDSFNELLGSFDRCREGSLAWEVSRRVKGLLIARAREGKRRYSVGEMNSCLRALIDLAVVHESWDGIGYLKWVRTCLEGRMPRTQAEIASYILQHETDPRVRAQAFSEASELLRRRRGRKVRRRHPPGRSR